jgi:hypothetical protein
VHANLPTSTVFLFVLKKEIYDYTCYSEFMRLLATILSSSVERLPNTIIAFEKGFKMIYPKDQEVCPPGGANTRQEGRPVMTLGPFMLAPEAKALLEIGRSC